MILKTRVCRYDWPLWSDVQIYSTLLITAEELATASRIEVPSSVGTHPHFITITAAPVCSLQDVKANFKWISVALPVLIHARTITIVTATFAHNIDSILGENVTVCILDGLKTLTPRTRGFAVAWEALRVISIGLTQLMSAVTAKTDALLPSSIFLTCRQSGFRESVLNR